METLKRYNCYEQPGTDEAQAVEEPAGLYMMAADVLRVLGERDAVEQDHSESHEAVAERLRVAEGKYYDLQEQVRAMQTDRENKRKAFEKVEQENDELRLELREQTKRAEDMVTMNATLIGARNKLQRERDHATLSCRLSNQMRDTQRKDLEGQRSRVGLLTGRLLDAGVLIASLAQRKVPSPENCSRSWEFVRLIRSELEGYTLTGPCDVPTLYAKLEIEMQPPEGIKDTEQLARELNAEVGLPAPEPGVLHLSDWLTPKPSGAVLEPIAITPVVDPRPVAPGFVGRHASDGTLVAVHPDFAKQLDESPGLWQGCVDAAAEDAKRLGIDPANPSEADKALLLQSAVLTPPEAEEPEEQDIQF